MTLIEYYLFLAVELFLVIKLCLLELCLVVLLLQGCMEGMYGISAIFKQ